jgi:glycosyltransferase involved in cell wall biosynthesis
MKIVIVHDFLKEYGGAERVVEVMHEMWPEAPIYTSFVDYNSLGPHAERIRKWNIVESKFGRTYLMKHYHSPLRFLAPKVWSGFDFSKFDMVISSSGWYMSKGISVKPPTVHICYLHHPPRHLYGYATAMEWQKYWPIRTYGQIVNHFLRMYDFESSQKVDYFIANSKETQRRITKFYRRESTVIYPPVEIQNPKSEILNLKQLHNYSNSQIPNKYFLTVSRLARAKHIDLLIETCQKLEENLVIVGKGREEARLRALIHNSKFKIQNDKQQKSITLLGEVNDELLGELYKSAKGFLFAGEDEEFGIAPVEAMGYGLPVIAYRSGGIPETVVDGTTGVLFDELTIRSLTKAIVHYNNIYFHSETMRGKMKRNCRDQAKKFSKERFKKELERFVEEKYNNRKR